MMAISVWVLTAYRRVEIALLLPLVLIGGRLLRVWPAKLLPALSLSLFLLHSPSTRWNTNESGVLWSLTVTTSSLEKLAVIREALFPRGFVSGQSTHASTDKKSVTTLTEGAPVAEALPEEADAIGDSRKKRQTLKHTWYQEWEKWGIWMPTNQIRAMSGRAYASRESCVRALQTSRGI